MEFSAVLRDNAGQILALVGGLLLGIGAGDIINQRATVGAPETGIAFSILQLIALLLPALAILLDVTLKYAQRGDIILSGNSVEIRKIGFIVTAFAGGLCSVAVLLLFAYLKTPVPIAASLALVSIAIVGFAAIPFTIYFDLRSRDHSSDLAKTIGLAQLKGDLDKLSEYSYRDLEEYTEYMDFDNPDILLDTPQSQLSNFGPSKNDE